MAGVRTLGWFNGPRAPLRRSVTRGSGICLPEEPRQETQPLRRSRASRPRQFRKMRPRYPWCMNWKTNKGQLVLCCGWSSLGLSQKWSGALGQHRGPKTGQELRHFDWSHCLKVGSRGKSHDATVSTSRLQVDIGLQVHEVARHLVSNEVVQ